MLYTRPGPLFEWAQVSKPRCEPGTRRVRVAFRTRWEIRDPK